MKILLCGAASTGKTTLQKALQAIPELKDYHFQREIIRPLKDTYGISINEQTDVASQKLILDSYGSMYRYHQEKGLKNVVYDRGPICALAFTQATRELGKPTDPRLTELSLNAFLNTMAFFDLFILTKPLPPECFEQSEYRSSDKKYQAKVDQIYEQFLSQLPPHRVVRAEGTVEVRVRKVIEAFNYLKSFEGSTK